MLFDPRAKTDIFVKNATLAQQQRFQRILVYHVDITKDFVDLFHRLL
jgi:hypothetical protein